MYIKGIHQFKEFNKFLDDINSVRENYIELEHEIDRLELKVCLYKAKLEGELYIEEKINKQLKINNINKNNIEEYKNLQCMFVFGVLNNEEYNKCINWLKE